MSKDVKRPLPPKPRTELYEHLTEKERMIAGFPYRPMDEQLFKERTRARQLVKKFNELEIGDKQGKQEIMDELFSSACRGKRLALQAPIRVDYGYNLTFGNNLDANFGCVFLDCAPITIGDNCLLAPGVHIYAATHPVDPKYRQDNDDYYELAFPVKIGNNVWIGGNAVVCPGVTIGDNCVIGSGSVVVKDIPPNSVAAGNPAKVIRSF